MKPGALITPEALFRFRPYQLETFWKAAGLFIWFWRRQAGKTTVVAAKSIRECAEIPGHSVIYASVSLAVAKELMMKGGQLYWDALEKFRADARILYDAVEQLRLAGKNEVNLAVDDRAYRATDLTAADFIEAFESKRLEIRIHHSNTLYSRILGIAPNPATARGFTGTVRIDEAGDIHALGDLMAAMEPIQSTQPHFRLELIGTPPKDDSHPFYELTATPAGLTFPPSARGHWYRSAAGVLVHRAAAYDVELAGGQLFHPETRLPLTVDAAREKSLNRADFDRNYHLRHAVGGTNALTRTALATAQRAGHRAGQAADLTLPTGGIDFTRLPLLWPTLLSPAGQLGLGLDLASTAGGKSNPSSLAIGELIDHVFIARLIVWFKTSNPADVRQLLRWAFAHLPRRARGLSIDATNDALFANDLAREFGSFTTVHRVKAGQKLSHKSTELNAKDLLTNLLVNRCEDGLLWLPTDEAHDPASLQNDYLFNDFRRVFRRGPSFETELGPEGQHGDTFDALKHAHWAALGSTGGPAEVGFTETEDTTAQESDWWHRARSSAARLWA